MIFSHLQTNGVLSVDGAAHVGAQKRCRGALLLWVPGRAAAGQISRVDVLGSALLKILIKARPSRPDAFLRLAAIEQA